MPFLRLRYSTNIADKLNLLAALVKTRSRASLTDANRLLETVTARFFSALFGWDLVNLNAEQANYPAVDLGDRKKHLAVQVTNEDGSDKIELTKAKAIKHELGKEFNQLIIFFLLPKKPRLPKKFIQPASGPQIETWDIADLLKRLQDLTDLDALARASGVLDEEMGNISVSDKIRGFDISRISRYVPAELIGRESETDFLRDAWGQAVNGNKRRLHILTFVAFGGEGKTSLVAKWAADLAHQAWPGCDAVFAWSFYSQGSLGQVASSSDLFLKEALSYFGDANMAESAQSAFEKGRRLAQIVGEQRALLILDGLEPLQYPPTSPMPGELKDKGISTMLKGLAAHNRGLCVVTTRYVIPDLHTFLGTTVLEKRLLRLSQLAGVTLLKKLGVNGRRSEFEKLVEDLQGHALTLNLIGGYLRDGYAGDIRRRDQVKLKEADAEIQGGHAFRVMDAYVLAFENGGKNDEERAKGQRALAILLSLGLFDRPASANCLNALSEGEAITGLTEPLINLNEAQYNLALSRLEAAKLIIINREEASGSLVSIDTHPLIREYFAKRLQEKRPEAWRSAHQRLYEHLCAVAPDMQGSAMMKYLGISPVSQPTLEDLQPLYQAVAHACHSGSPDKGWTEVFLPRILRGSQFYSYSKLGAVGSDLDALACFFDTMWTRVSPLVSESTRSRVLNAAGLRLRMLGRLREALEAHEEAVKIEGQFDPLTRLRNLSEVQMALGRVDDAVHNSTKCLLGVTTESEKVSMLALHADALHQAGRQHEANKYFQESEKILEKTDFPFLHSLHGFRYCDFLLAVPERMAWKLVLDYNSGLRSTHESYEDRDANIMSCRDVYLRVSKTIKIAQNYLGPFDIALDNLSIGRALLYEAIMVNDIDMCLPRPENSDQGAKPINQSSRRELDLALDNLHRAGNMDEVPRVLMTRAWLRFFTGIRVGANSSQRDLDDAWEIAERGPMRLFLADIYLHRARLFFCETPYPWNRNSDGSTRGPTDDLIEAERLISQCGYHRRYKELADAKKVIFSNG